MTDSPCTGRCTLDGEICIGCRRTISEIKSWHSLSDEQREVVLKMIEHERKFPL